MSVPDICPSDALGDGRGGEFSLIAGDFEEIYGGQLDPGSEEKQDHAGQWDAVVTCFFIDCVSPASLSSMTSLLTL